MKVIISMTSTPARIGTLDATLESLAAQTIRADEVRLYGTGDVVMGNYRYINSRLLTCARIFNFDPGPIAKLSALVDPDSDLSDDDLVITVDDDIVYESKWLETLVEGAVKHPDCAVGMSGWNVDGFIEALCTGDHSPELDTYRWASSPSFCDVLEGYAGIAYRRRHFFTGGRVPSRLFRPDDTFRNVDDVWIAAFLRHAGTKRMLLCPRMCRERDGALPGLHHREDFIELNRRASIVAFGDRR